MKFKYMTSLVQRDGKHFVSVATPISPNIEEPTSFEPDDEHEKGPFDLEEAARAEQVKIEADLRKRGQLWIPPAEYKALKKARGKTTTKTKQRSLY